MDTTRSMLEVAYEEMKNNKKSMSFAELYDFVVKTLEMNDDEKKANVGEFFTELTLDGRFVALTDNNWDLRARHTYEKVHIDVNDVYTDVEEGDDDEEDKEDEKEYDAAIEGKEVVADKGEDEESEENDKQPVEDVDVASLVGVDK
ncbi:MAG: DNA-directed RNA polymerase subunit delta [Bacilli bacterium]|jgi:DNA-directed RNA polymerase subunit delta|nr:DNA-directed RNA polymerase subunit delta [Bacilli bacterium]MCH4210792.1 DNA-directed RNA polymerase subunit delta [Bacilli bacterium]MCH4228583.1 DNA-directed RNA polymerase subunit delta [Bacilli bacterium]MCH4277889.1 DNA-directed RNA polymerase subunit delta [Bacilli bacterium]MCI2055316.1 DNA-directed RNA polymerase subunit delta [Bacilli bacterium]